MYINALLKKILFISLLLHSVLSQDSKFDKNFFNSLSPITCVRLLNSTGIIGCQSLKPASGILIFTRTQDALNDFVNSNRKGKFVVLLPYELMTNDNLRSLESSRKMSGVLALINGTDPNSATNSSIIQRPINFSPDEKCPNCQFDLYKNDENRYQWNPNGLGIIQERYDFPIFAIYPYDKKSIRTYFRIVNGAAFNERRLFQKFPLKAAELTSFMFAAIDAPTCLRRKICSPVGGHSVYSTPSIDMNENDGKPIIVVSAAMDSKSLFHDITLGVNNGISGSIALFAIADALRTSPTPVKNFKKHILFTSFAGESWGFLGSQRFVKNIFEPFNCIKNNTKPTPSCVYKTGDFGGCTYPCFRDIDFKRINFNNINSIFELSSLSNGLKNGGTKGVYFAHVDDDNNNGNKFLVQGLETLSGGIVRKASEDGVIRKLPPSSSMAFLEKNRNIPAVVISDFQASLNDYYNSEYDDGSDLDVLTITNSICSIANVVSQAIWLHAQDLLNSATPVPITVNCTLVGELLDCLTVNTSCPQFKSFSNNDDGRISHYTGVFQQTSRFPLPSFHYNVLGSLNADSISDRVCKKDVDCEFGETCVNLHCTRSFTRLHHSYGIGLEFNENGDPTVVDPEKATWVESIWNDFNLKLFNMTSTNSQISELISGVLLTTFSCIGVFFGQKYLRKSLKID